MKPSDRMQDRRMSKYKEALAQNTVSEASKKQANRNMNWRKKKAARMARMKRK